MQDDEILLEQAVFSPKVRTYIFIVVAWYLLIMVFTIPLMIIWLCGFGQWLSKAFFHTLKCKLTNKNLSFAKGLIIHTEKTIPLENIQDLSFIGGPILRWFGLTMIRVETAGGGNKHGSNMMSLLGVENAEAFKNKILAQREMVKLKYDQKNQSGSNDIELLSGIKNELEQIKMILKDKTI